MEKNQENVKKKNMSIKTVTSGGGGLAGIILLGGALATAALVWTFAFKRKQKSKKGDEVDSLKKCSKVVKKDDNEVFVGDGLSFLVQDSLSPQLNNHHHPSNGIQDESVSRETMILDETSQVNGEKDEEIDILKKAREGLLCDGSFTIIEEFTVPVGKSLPLLKPDEMTKNDRLEENAVSKVDEKTTMAESNQVAVVDNDQHIPLAKDEVCDGIGKNIDRNNKQLAEAEAALADQVGVDGKDHMPVEKCSENTEAIIEREEVLVEVPQSEQLGIDHDYQMLGDKCDGNGQVLVENREGLAEAAVVNKIRADEECDADVGITIEKGEELVGCVAANGIQLSEKLEFTTMYGDQDILCSDSTITKRHENGTCDVNKTNLLLMTDSLSLLKPANNDLIEELLVIDNTKILEGNEAEKTSVQEYRGETQLVGPNKDCKILRVTANDKWEGADEIGNHQQMQPFSDKSSPEINSFPCNGFEVQEFSFPLLDSPPCFNFGNLIKDDYSQTALHVEDVNTMEKDRSANEVFSYQIMSEKKSQSTNNDEMKSFSDSCEIDVAEGEETLETGVVDIGDGSKNDEEAVEMIETENFELENNQPPPSKEDNSDTDCVEEDTDDEDEESSETTGGSSLDSNAEAIWPVESVQEFSRKVKPIQDNNNFMETERGDGYINFNKHNLEEEDKDSFKKGFSNKLTAEITTVRQPIWFLSLLVPFLLLLWLLSSQISSPDPSRCHMQ